MQLDAVADDLTGKHLLPITFVFKVPDLGVETIEPSLKVSTRGECTMYVDMYNQEITRPLPVPNKTFVAYMCRISDFREGGDGTVPESSGGALKGEGILKTSRVNKYAHQEVYKQRKARAFVITAIRNLALKRIEEGIKEGGVGNAK